MVTCNRVESTDIKLVISPRVLRLNDATEITSALL